MVFILKFLKSRLKFASIRTFVSNECPVSVAFSARLVNHAENAVDAFLTPSIVIDIFDVQHKRMYVTQN